MKYAVLALNIRNYAFTVPNGFMNYQFCYIKFVFLHINSEVSEAVKAVK